MDSDFGDDTPTMDSTPEIRQHSALEPEMSCLDRRGYIYHKTLATTLQGEIFEATIADLNDISVVIKRASKHLVANRVAMYSNSKKNTVSNDECLMMETREDIHREIAITQYLDSYSKCNKHCVVPPAHIQTVEVLEDDENIYVVSEHGGTSLFDWNRIAHQRIERGTVSLKYWRKNLKFLFKQMVDYVDWLHDTMHVCHLDISLENMLVQNGDHFLENGKFTYSQQVKFCDFGLAEYFDVAQNPSFQWFVD